MHAVCFGHPHTFSPRLAPQGMHMTTCPQLWKGCLERGCQPFGRKHKHGRPRSTVPSTTTRQSWCATVCTHHAGTHAAANGLGRASTYTAHAAVRCYGRRLRRLAAAQRAGCCSLCGCWHRRLGVTADRHAGRLHIRACTLPCCQAGQEPAVPDCWRVTGALRPAPKAVSACCPVPAWQQVSEQLVSKQVLA